MAMRRISDYNKIDIGLVPSNLNGAGTGEYFPMRNSRKALFVVSIGAMAVGATSVIQVMQAQDAAGTGAKVVTNNAATITANTRVAAATFTAAACAPADTAIVNGVTFTGGAAENSANRIFLADAADNNATAASLAAVINAHLPQVRAAANAAVVTVTSRDPGNVTVTVTGTAVRLIAATVRAVGYVECDVGYLDEVNGFGHVAVRVTNSAAMQTGAALLRGENRYSLPQTVAAGKADVL
jgi:hypothetical protein